MKVPCLLGIAAVASAIATQTHAQGSVLIGRVFSDSGMVLVGAEVVLNGPQNSQRTNDKGEFKFTAVPAGLQIIGVRMPGYAPRVDTIEVADAGELRREFKLSRIETTLPKVPVTATLLDRKLSNFYERRRGGIGRFLDSAEFSNRRGTKTSDRLASLPGIRIERGRSTEAFVTNTRQRLPGEPGSKSWCRALVWLDNVNLGTNFNVNELDPSIIAAVEWYAGEASIPARFAVPQKPGELYCGVLLIWLR
jgi:hypothetical protein